MDIFADEISEGDELADFNGRVTAAPVGWTDVLSQETFYDIPLGRYVITLNAHEYVRIGR